MGPTASPGTDRFERVRRVARVARRFVRREWRRGRLDLTDLPPGTRRLATTAVILIIASAAIVAVDAFGLAVPGPAIEVAGRALGITGVATVPLLAMVVACLGLCSASASLAVADRLGDRRLSAIGLAAIGLLGVSISAALVSAARAVGRSATAVPEDAAGSFVRAAAIIEPIGVFGMASGLLTIALAISPRYRPRPWLLAVASTAPFLAATVLVVAGLAGAVDLGPDAAAVGLPRNLTIASYVVPWFLVITTVVASWLVPIGLWQVVTWTRASRRDIGIPVAIAGDGWPWLLAALLTLKLGWLGLGYLGSLPSPLLGGSPAWEAAEGDGIVAWLIAIGLAVVAGWWLASTRRLAVSERGFGPAAAIIVVGFSLVTVLTSLVLLAFPIAQLLPGTPPTLPITAACASTWSSEGISNTLTCLLDGIASRTGTLTLLADLATLGVAAILAIAWRHHRGRRSMVIFLTAVVVWVAPRVPDAIGALLGRDLGPSIAPQLTTLDTTLTVVLAALTAAWYTGRQRGAGPRSLILVLVVSTLITLPTGSAVDSEASPFFLIALLFPIAYELLLDSEGLNRRVPGRSASVLASLGIRVGVLSLLALGVVLGDPGAASPGLDEVGKVLFAVPFAALVVAATLSRRAFAPSPATISAPTPSRRHVARGVVGAIVALSAAVIAGTSLDLVASGSWPNGAVSSPSPTSVMTPSPAATPLPRARLSEFLTRQRSVGGSFATLLSTVGTNLASSSGASAATDAADLAALIADERSWLREHEPADCFVPAVHAWEAELDLLDEFTDRLSTLDATSSQADVDAALEPTAGLPDADQKLVEALDLTRTACALPSPEPS